MHLRPNEQGYTLLLTMLILSILLSVSFGIHQLALRSLMLSTALRDSQKAFNAADRGMECAMYWDRVFRNTGYNRSVFKYSAAYTSPGPAVCSGQTLAITNTTLTNGYQSDFVVNYSDRTCVEMTVYKYNTGQTKYVANGQSDGGATPGTCSGTSLRRSQRSIEVRL